MRRDTVNISLVAAIIGCFGILVAGFIVNVGWSAKDVETVANIVQAVAAAAAVGLGAAFAYRNSVLFRTFEPHLDISHAVSHRNVGASYVHVSVVATLYNSSRVKITITEGFFQLLQISPMDDNDIAALYAQTLPDNETDETFEIPWPVIRELPLHSHLEGLVIEPGQSHSEIAEFIVDRGTRAVLVYSYFANAMAGEAADSASGWDLTTPYDIIVNK